MLVVKRVLDIAFVICPEVVCGTCQYPVRMESVWTEKPRVKGVPHILIATQVPGTVLTRYPPLQVPDTIVKQEKSMLNEYLREA